MNAEFTTVEWARNTNIYEINVRQYTPEGTFNAFKVHLPRLRDMGVQVLWFMPIHPIGAVKRLGTLGSYYSIQDYKAINTEFGTIDDFKALIKTAHQMGFKIIIDWVANHTSWDHIWTINHPDFFARDESGNFRSPYDWADVIQLNHHNPQQQDAMIDAMKFWLDECAIDGFRCDMAHLVPLAFWQRARAELDQHRKLFWLAETEEAHYHEVFDVTYAWELLHKMEQYWRKETDIAGLDAVLNRYRDNFAADALRTLFTSNHDENSHSGSEYERMGDAAEAFAVFCATWSGIPLVYSGQELPNKKRLKFFDKDQIDWKPECGLHGFYKTLLRLRATNPAFQNDSPLDVLVRVKTSEPGIFGYLRKNGEREVLVLLNLTGGALQFQLAEEQAAGTFTNVFSAQPANLDLQKEFSLAAWKYLVFEK